tara:strand:+ start:194 stop:637 length:444 start_codon:yes stop_codon:yes gene_type:complete
MKLIILITIVYIILYIIFRLCTTLELFEEHSGEPADVSSEDNKKLTKEDLDKLIKHTWESNENEDLNNRQNKRIKELRNKVDELRNDIVILRRNKSSQANNVFNELKNYDKIYDGHTDNISGMNFNGMNLHDMNFNVGLDKKTCNLN